MSGYLARLKAAHSGNALLDALPKLPKGAFGSNDSSPGSTFSEVEAANTASDTPTADRWTVHFDDRDPLEIVLPEPATHAAILARYPEAVGAEAVERRSRPATDREAAELRLLIRDVQIDDGDRAEALTAALADVEDALVCYRALAGREPDHYVEMQSCLQCAAYAVAAGRCGQAAKGAALGFRAHRGFRPVFPDRPQRCAGFLPLADDDDQRTGAERWPWLLTE